MGKRDYRSKKRPSQFERRSKRPPIEGSFHKKRANRIANLVIVAAVFTVANIFAGAYGRLPYDYFYFVLVQYSIYLAFGILLYFIYVWNSRVPVYREVFWMIVIYSTVTSIFVSSITL